MKITLAAIGKMKSSSPEAALLQEYSKRLAWKLTVKELPQSTMEKEADALLAACAGATRIVALDERGKDISSREFATRIAQWQQQGMSHLAIVIGGADGLHASVRDKADFLFAFGRATWPHMLVRAMIAEQLYRASTILDNHPYHRD